MPVLNRAPRHVLIVALRYLGDVLLTTPLARAVRERYPDCAVDMLVFQGTQGMLENNPDVRHVHTIAERPAKGELPALLNTLRRQYDLALIPQPGDRPHLFGLVAARVRVGLVPPKLGHAWWKRMSLRQPLPTLAHTHRIHENERVAALVDALPARTVVPPTAGLRREDWAVRLDLAFDVARPFAVLHPSPRWRYKQWHDAGWCALTARLHEAGVQVLVSGGPGEAESQYLDRILAPLPADVRAALIRIQGKLSLAEMADLLKHAHLYVGPDTATTHLAAACGTPTLALFGPTDPRQWGPSPASGLDQGWAAIAPTQRRGNVIMLQQPLRACVPCQLEGCERHRGSHSDCMDQMPTQRVVDEAMGLLTTRAGRHKAATANHDAGPREDVLSHCA
ncbi:glycosyltransferase family 9 protein [Achromobacter sp. GG226]|uniref:glycosyltransferase family 9 protein n=1 Tax=Verticiella alkaliphila TaxID=2779529 RepID=UPI001C0E86CC|nr:glycosyltransferase family 9 protein [Verticiella sp. GG226]MBU4609814.1 glycosyltransferase family 9 protein [Verticiella sp. GG226]